MNIDSRIPLYLGIVLLAASLVGTVLVVRSRLAAGAVSSSSAPATMLAPGRGQLAVSLPGLVQPFGQGDVRAGDSVTALAFFLPAPGRPGMVTRVMLEHVIVISSDTKGPTLAVTPEQAVLLQQAEQLGARQVLLLESRRGNSGGTTAPTFGDADLAQWLPAP